MILVLIRIARQEAGHVLAWLESPNPGQGDVGAKKADTGTQRRWEQGLWALEKLQHFGSSLCLLNTFKQGSRVVAYCWKRR